MQKSSRSVQNCATRNDGRKKTVLWLVETNLDNFDMIDFILVSHKNKNREIMIKRKFNLFS